MGAAQGKPEPQRKAAEAQMQREVIRLLVRAFPGIEFQGSVAGVYLGRNRKVLGRLYKLMGNKPGFPDVIVLERGSAGEPGLALELKAPRGRLSDAQRARHEKLQLRGWAVVVCFSAQAAVDAVRQYLPANWQAPDSIVVPPIVLVTPPPPVRAAVVQLQQPQTLPRSNSGRGKSGRPAFAPPPDAVYIELLE